MNIFHKRQGQVDDFHVYFYTETINEFHHLLHHDAYKLIVIESRSCLPSVSPKWDTDVTLKTSVSRGGDTEGKKFGSTAFRESRRYRG
ncbi:hypothetical protein BH10BAC3_BH10BAC3_36690 [soil metagenome]